MPEILPLAKETVSNTWIAAICGPQHVSGPFRPTVSVSCLSDKGLFVSPAC
jgi:hypothetical protein